MTDGQRDNICTSKAPFGAKNGVINVSLCISECQVVFWLTFLQSRIPPVEPLGDRGRSPKPAPVMLVGSHADTTRRQNPGPALVANTERLRAEVVRRFGHVFSVEDIILMMDSGAAGSQEIKTFKNLLQQRKQQIIEVCVSITREINCWLRE